MGQHNISRDAERGHPMHDNCMPGQSCIARIFSILKRRGGELCDADSSLVGNRCGMAEMAMVNDSAFAVQLGGSSFARYHKIDCNYESKCKST